MSDSRRPFVRTSLGKLAVTGAATLATVFALAPAATAEDAPATTEPAQTTEPVAEDEAPAPEPEETPEEAPVEEPPAEEAPAETPAEPPAEELAPDEVFAEKLPNELVAPAEEVEEVAAPVYGPQNFTISVSIDPDAVTAPDATTVGSVFDVVIVDQDGKTLDSFSCTTFGTAASTDSTCEDDEARSTFSLPAGAKAVITQTQAGTGLVRASEPTTIEPCDASTGTCDPDGKIKTTDLDITNFGPAPAANNDTAETDENEPVSIDVLANDDSVDDENDLVVASQPAHGTAVVQSRIIEESGNTTARLAIPGGPTILYSPDEDYSGADSFTYSVTNANGTSTGTVNITVNAVGEVEPDFGFQKFRVGVQLQDGSWVPNGSTTVGSVFKIAVTDEDGSTTTTTCTTTEQTLEDDGSSYCPGGGGIGLPLSRATAPPQVGEDPGFAPDQWMILEPGATATITQVSAPSPLVKSTDAATVEPCETDPDFIGVPFCTTAGSDDDDFFPLKVTRVLFNNTGPLPVARPDSSSTDEGDAVRIDVLKNDDSGDPGTGLRIASQPGDGTATVVGQADAAEPEPEEEPLPGLSTGDELGGATINAVPRAGSLAIRYTPRAGLTGTDTFRYTLDNSNGSDTTTVTVKVKGGAVSDTSTSTTSSTDDDAVLPDTGGADLRLLGLGGLLLAGGGAIAARGRRRTASID